MPSWPQWDEFDYRYGFPLRRDLAEHLDGLPDEEREELVARLERASVEVLTAIDIERLPETTD